IRRRRRLRNTRFPAARYSLTGAGLSPTGPRQLRLTHRYQRFESISPPAASQVRTCLSREFAFLGREAAVFRGWAPLGWRRGRRRRAGWSNIAPRNGNISVGPYSSTAVAADAVSGPWRGWLAGKRVGRDLPISVGR